MLKLNCCLSKSDKTQSHDKDDVVNETEAATQNHNTINKATTTTANQQASNCSQHLDNFKKFCKNIAAFLFSRVGLCFAVVLYVILGGLLFQYIERDNESAEKENYREFVRNVTRRTDVLVEEIWNMTKSELIFQERNYTTRLRFKLNLHKDKYIDALFNGYNENERQEHEKWTVPGSILYAVTLVTSIGYGHITCVTSTGKLITIFYSIIGIPMMALCLANIGKSEANLCRFLYSQVCCGYCNYIKRRNQRLRAAAHQSRLQSIQSSMRKKSTMPNNAELNELEDLKFEEKNEMEFAERGKSLVKIDDVEMIDYLSDANSVDYTKITVPISVTLTILSSYIFLGGLLFKSLENWSMLDGVYFCFITLSTVGLGDFVPGNSINDNDTQAELKLIGCSFYLLMGLSLLMMGFNLMQEEVIHKIKRLGVTLGIINDPNYW